MIRTGVALSSKKMRANTTLVRSMLLCFTMLVLTLSGKAQQPGKSVRIGLLEDGRATANTELLEAFRQQMAQLGWVEGKNLIIEYRFGEGKGAKQLAVFAAEISYK